MWLILLVFGGTFCFLRDFAFERDKSQWKN